MAKGGAFERSVAKILSLWVSEGEDESWIWRTSQSGGRATTRAKKGDKTSGAYGDLTFTDSRSAWFFDLFSVELKCGYKGADISSLIDSKQKLPLLLEFWEQCSRDKELSAAKWGLLIIKRDRKIPLIVIESDCLNDLVFLFGHPDFACIGYYNGILRLEFMQFDAFFDWIDPETLKEILQ